MKSPAASLWPFVFPGETMPPTKTELERRADIALAELCGKVAGSSSADFEEALGLRQEWVSLVGRETPPPSLTKQQEIDAEKESLRNRMIEFLARIKWPTDVKWSSD